MSADDPGQEPSAAEYDALMRSAVEQRAQLIVAEIQRITAENDASLMEVRRMGTTVTESSLQGVRLMVTTDYLLGSLDGSPPGYLAAEFPRLGLELAVQQRYAEQFGPLLSQLRQAKLTAGIATQGLPPAANASTLYVPGRR